MQPGKKCEHIFRQQRTQQEAAVLVELYSWAKIMPFCCSSHVLLGKKLFGGAGFIAQ